MLLSAMECHVAVPSEIPMLLSDTGEVFVKLPDGSPSSDSIGNIFRPLAGAIMSGETWARVSLRIAGGRLTSAELEQLIGVKSAAGPEKCWAVDITSDSATALSEQLSVVKGFLLEKITILEGLADENEINLSIGWTPRNPQDGIVLDTELIALLSRIGCYVLLDTYLD